ncbi:LEA type 2 family protein [Persicitalea sp.]|uniref:LEA type 2 family protein n=1 Tax=Persicitalea sp. TaxID=3100273 RepID=UPI0035944CDE
MNLSKTTKTLLIFLALLLLGAAVFYFYKQENANPVSGLKPRLEMAAVRIDAITDSTLDLTLDLLLDNPLPVGLDVANMAYSVKMNETVILEDEYAKPFVVKASDSSSLSISTQLNLKNLIAEVNEQDRLDNDSADYHFEGVFHLRKPFLGKDTLRLAMDRRAFVYHLPEIKVVGFNLEKFRLSESEVLLRLQVTNDNPIALEFKNPTYSIDLGKQGNVLEGSNPGGTKVGKNSNKTFEVPFTVDMGELLKTGGQLLFQGNSLPFKLNFKCKLASDNEMLKNSDLNYVVEGDMEDLQELKKMIDKK